jgi:allantoin racemase
VKLANAAIEERNADVAILAGAPLSGLAHRARDLIHVPVIDPIAAAVKQAEALVALGTTKASRGSFQRPAAKDSLGLSPRLAAYLEHAQ